MAEHEEHYCEVEISDDTGGAILHIEGDNFGDDDGGLLISVEWIKSGNSAVSYGVCKELEGTLQEEADALYQAEAEATFEYCCQVLERTARKWVYWRCAFDPSGEFQKEADEEEAKRVQEAVKRKEEEIKRREEAAARIYQPAPVSMNPRVKATAIALPTQTMDARQFSRKMKALIQRMSDGEKVSKTELEDLLKNLNYSQRKHLQAAIARLQNQKREMDEQLDALTQLSIVQTSMYKDMQRPDQDDYQFLSQNLLLNMELAIARGVDRFYFTFERATKVPPLIKKLSNTLVELNLMYNELAQLPAEISALIHLRKLVLTSNKLRSCENINFKALKHLQVLKLGENELEFVPADLCECSELRVVELERNKPLHHIPFSIGKLKKLEFLGLDNTSLKMLPPELGTVSTLQSLKLKSTPMKMIPIDVYQKGTEEVLKFLRGYIPEESEIDGSTLSKELDTYSNKKEFSDLTYFVNESTFSAHKCVLSARCPTLMSAYQIQEIDGKDTIQINGISSEVFEQLLLHVYNDSVDVKLGNKSPKFTEELLSLSEFHKLPRLLDVCNQETQFGRILEEKIPESTLAQDIAKLYINRSYHDITFNIEGEEIVANKVIMASRCDYFRNMFLSGLKEAQQSIIELSDVSAPVFNAVLEYLYTDDVAEINGEIAIELLIAASAYGIQRLKRLVENVVGYSLDADNAACIMDVAVLYDCEVLSRACTFFVVRDYKTVRRTDGWSEMNQQTREFIREQAKMWGVMVDWPK